MQISPAQQTVIGVLGVLLMGGTFGVAMMTFSPPPISLKLEPNSQTAVIESKISQSKMYTNNWSTTVTAVVQNTGHDILVNQTFWCQARDKNAVILGEAQGDVMAQKSWAPGDRSAMSVFISRMPHSASYVTCKRMKTQKEIDDELLASIRASVATDSTDDSADSSTDDN